MLLTFAIYNKYMPAGGVMPLITSAADFNSLLRTKFQASGYYSMARNAIYLSGPNLNPADCNSFQ